MYVIPTGFNTPVLGRRIVLGSSCFENIKLKLATILKKGYLIQML